jgi:hypothetical protein
MAAHCGAGGAWAGGPPRPVDTGRLRDSLSWRVEHDTGIVGRMSSKRNTRNWTRLSTRAVVPTPALDVMRKKIVRVLRDLYDAEVKKDGRNEPSIGRNTLPHIRSALSTMADIYYEAAPATASPPLVAWSLVDSVNDGLSLNCVRGWPGTVRLLRQHGNGTDGTPRQRCAMGRGVSNDHNGVDVFPDR